MRTTFLDPGLDEMLDRDGYVIVPLLGPDEVDRLNAAYDRLGAAPGDPQRACVDTFHCFDTTYKEAVHGEVESVLAPAVEPYFDRYKSLSYCYIQKWPGERSGFGLHADISVLDETKYRSVEVWVALTDTSEENGQLWVVPGSHKWAPGSVRGIHGFPPPYAGLEERIISRHSIPVPVKAGDAVIFCHSTLHFSFENNSGSFRLVAATDMIPDEAQHLHWVANDRGTIDEFEIEESFWVEQNPFTLMRAPAHLKRVGEVDPADLPRLTDEDLDRLIAEGHGVEHEPYAHGRINPDLTWCHRCGTTQGVEGYVDPYNGNVTLLCPRCEAAQARMAGVIGDIDPVVLDALAGDGYTVLELLEPAELAELRDGSAAEVLQRAVDRQLAGYQVFRSTAGPVCGLAEAAAGLHQDWTSVDERHQRAYSVLVPVGGRLDAVVVAGSHRWLEVDRGPGLASPFAPFADEIVARGGRTISLTEGQALVLDQALLHATTVEDGATVHAAGIAAPRAGIVQLHRGEDGKVSVYGLPAGADYDATFGAVGGSLPEGEPMRVFEEQTPTIGPADLDRWLPAAPEAPAEPATVAAEVRGSRSVWSRLLKR